MLLLIGCEILVIVDDYVDCEFGMGVVKVMFVYDFNDYQVGVCYKFVLIEILMFDVKINDNGFEQYCGFDCFDVCKVIVVDFDVQGFFDFVKLYKLMVLCGDCMGVVIELLLIDQWFVVMMKLVLEGMFNLGKLIIEVLFDVVCDGQIKFVLENWMIMYYQWFENIQDWCILCQLWWGYQIFVWYGENGEVFVVCNEEDVCV